MKEKALIGCLLGTAVGDALGLPYEGMTGKRGGMVFPDRDRLYFLPGYGMVSDDTEHACFTAQSIIGAQGDPDMFERHLAWSLRWWLLGLPAGVGLATLRSILKLWIGIPPARAGVFSAGNGPAMRSSVLGVLYGDSPAVLREFVLRSTRLTHSDPKAFHGALAVAVAAHLSAQGRTTAPQEYVRVLKEYLADDSAGEFLSLVDRACRSAEHGENVAAFADAIGSRNGISGYMYHTVPCVIQAWLRHQKDYAAGVKEIIAAGGDADTTAAILGGIIGAGVGKEGIPERWLSHIIEWPRSVAWIERLATAAGKALAGDPTVRSPRYFAHGLLVRNTLFMVIVLTHGLRRLFPPYR
jgi:ADP-ribosyl-[dinitrogen reductase] hydrolase